MAQYRAALDVLDSKGLSVDKACGDQQVLEGVKAELEAAIAAAGTSSKDEVSQNRLAQQVPHHNTYLDVKGVESIDHVHVLLPCHVSALLRARCLVVWWMGHRQGGTRRAGASGQ